MPELEFQVERADAALHAAAPLLNFRLRIACAATRQDIDPTGHWQAQVAGEEIRVRGLVQGVGFRPTVWRLACDCHLAGYVRNDSDGVLIRAWGAPAALAAFVRRIRARQLLLDGKIVAIKGLGGFHLACDAGNAQAVGRLRSRKLRYHKAFALMARDVAMVERYCSVSQQERALLHSPMAPIVLCDVLRGHSGAGPARLPAAIAPGLATLGFMLPYTPLHHLLPGPLERPLVLSSGCATNRNAPPTKRRASAWPASPTTCCCMTAISSTGSMIPSCAASTVRRACCAVPRGYAPAALPLPAGFQRAPPILAMGRALKNTFCLLADGQAILLPHQGDLEEGATQLAYRRNLDLLRERIRATGCPTVQINTGTGCHLDAAMLAHGLRELNPGAGAVLMIENVGNLVCPALFDLGERAKVVILSVTEGEDKPLKYPHMFKASEVLLLNKIDLLPYLKFDVEKCIAHARQVNPSLRIFRVSAQTGEGMAGWYAWLREQYARRAQVR